MSITRRGAMIGAGGLLALAGGADSPPLAGIAIHDSRIAESRAFADEAHVAGLHTFDIAGEEANLWRRVRAGFAGAPLLGLTRWSDWTVLRGALEAQNLRVRREVRLDCGRADACSVISLIADPSIARASIPGKRQTLFAWAMRPKGA